MDFRYDREEGNGGGCLTLIKEGIPYRKIGRKGEFEYVGVEVWLGRKVMRIINFYNPCKKLETSKLEEMGVKGDIIWCGDFNAYHLLWGSEAIIMPVKKPGKDHSDPGNYRSIALTSNVSKVMKRMVNER